MSTAKVILIVEDDDGIRETLKYALELEGYEVFSAANGKLALDLLPKIQKPSLILLDLMMPEMNGFEFMDIVGKDANFGAIPIVVLTAFAGKTKAINAHGIIRKPVELQVIFDVAKRWCENAAARA